MRRVCASPVPGRPRRSGRMNALWTLILSGLLLVGLLVALLFRGAPIDDGGTATLKLYCAAGMRVPVEEVIRRYEAEYGIKVIPQYGGSNTLLSQIQVNKFDTADLFLAADDAYTAQAVELGLAAETLPIADVRPVIAVARSSKRIQTFSDLLDDDVSVAMADPDQAAVGKATRRLLMAVPTGTTDPDAGNARVTAWDQLERHVTDRGVFKPTVNDVANDVRLGAVDAGIVWDSTVAMPKYREHLRAVSIPELEGDPDQLSIAVLTSSRQPTAALRFARYLSAADRGLPVFEEYGMRPIEGDRWAERPNLTFFCGAVNRRAIEPIVADFKLREGVDVNMNYNGCGVLTSVMQTIEGQRPDRGFPDVYMACDRYYLENVADWFQEATELSDTEIVIAVPKGSARVRSLADLLEPGVRVAVGQPEQCTIGALTRRILAAEGLYEGLMAKQRQDGEVVVEKSSSALLIPDVVTGHVDAAIAYISDTLAHRGEIDVIRIDSALNLAIQPFSIARTSPHKHLARRLLRRLAAAPQAFEAAGFHFRLDTAAGLGPGASIREP